MLNVELLIYDVLEVDVFHEEDAGVGHIFAPEKFAHGFAGAPDFYFDLRSR